MFPKLVKCQIPVIFSVIKKIRAKKFEKCQNKFEQGSYIVTTNLRSQWNRSQGLFTKAIWHLNLFLLHNIRLYIAAGNTLIILILLSDYIFSNNNQFGESPLK